MSAQKHIYISIVCIFFFILTALVHGEESLYEKQILYFLDREIPQLLQKYSVPGTVIALVHGDNVILKGYGKLGFEIDEPMDAEQTPVFVASLSKLFTSTGIMQLYEQNRISLNVNINHYLSDFQIVCPYSEPITIHHLLTHTAGFDDRFLGMGAPTLDKVLPLGVYLSKRLPPIVFPPGTAISYSNHGFALLGHVIEQVSGKSFKDYMEEHLFEPLEMSHSRFDGTYPETLKPPKAYLEYFGKIRPVEMDFAQTPPASSLCTTAEDFSHFLIAMLNDGRYKDRFILQPKTVKLMQTPRYKLHPLLPGYACCWEERYINGKRTLQHSGLTWGFSSHVLIIPDEKFGLFISINKGEHALISEAIQLLVSKFTLPIRNIPSIRKNPSFVDPSYYRAVSGFYRHNRYCRSDYFKLATFLPGFVQEIYVLGDDTERTLFMRYLAFQSGSWKVEELGDMLWGRKTQYGDIASSPRITFIKGVEQGRHQLVIGNNVYEPIHFCESKLCQYTLFFACIAVFIIQFLRFFARLLIQKNADNFLQKHSDFIQNISIIFLVYILVFTTYLFLFLKPQSLGYGTPLILFIIILLSFLLFFLTIIGTIRFILSLKELRLQTFFDLLALLACYGMLFLFYYWNILDFHLSSWDTLYIN
ncbi:MAG TPA: serine hydrolase domain-containing protein [Candidatus Hydrogenedens sp.]|nr:serine hydrolase domain-containing protein [Candidatus Hydrogenedens sp.]